MGIQVREKSVEEIEAKLGGMATDLNKINYLESAVRESGFGLEIKKFIWGLLAGLYEGRKMFEKAGRAMAAKAGLEAMARDKVDDYLNAAELFAKAGRIEDADDMFVRALRDCGEREKQRVKLARKNIYSVFAEDLDSKGKKASAVKFYEKLIKMNLDESEKGEIRRKLIERYNALGMFREAKLLG